MFPPAVETSVMKQLGLTQQPITSQVLPRDLHAEYIATLALIATSIENWATEIRGLQRSEIHEVEEHFRAGQKGSSAMPHKRNPNWLRKPLWNGAGNAWSRRYSIRGCSVMA